MSAAPSGTFTISYATILLIFYLSNTYTSQYVISGRLYSHTKVRYVFEAFQKNYTSVLFFLHIFDEWRKNGDEWRIFLVVAGKRVNHLKFHETFTAHP